jgi:UDP-GlcNAc3NAcA epimerase
MKIVTVVGARPQFIKAAVVSRAVQQCRNLQEVIVHTGQHYDRNMSQVFFEEMEIPEPAYNLSVRETLHGAMTGKMLQEIERVLLLEKPDTVLVYGDTNSTLAAALAASKLHIPVAHVEAGLRSYNMRMPEEINRVLTDRISSQLFCPTERSRDNLKNEGFESILHQLHLTGDVMYDAVLFYFSRSTDAIISHLGLSKHGYILATIHRAENTDEPGNLHRIVAALNQLHEVQPVVVPLHPRTAKRVQESGIKPCFNIIEPLGYLDMLQLLHHCSLVLTDSGGLQKEAYFFKKYCVVLREQTEWVELQENGLSVLAGSDQERITVSAGNFLHRSYEDRPGLYGDGRAGEKIVNILASTNRLCE